MSGRFSRNKGRREEQQLVLHLATKYYKAERILRQYQESGQPDVKAVKGDKTLTFEMKARREEFRSIYDLYYEERDGDGVLKFVLGSNGIAVAVSTNFEDLLDSTALGLFRNLVLFPREKKLLKVYERLVDKIAKWRGSADFLVLKDNNKPRLFVRAWK